MPTLKWEENGVKRRRSRQQGESTLWKLKWERVKDGKSGQQ